MAEHTGRPPIPLTPALHDAIVAAVEHGSDRITAAAAAGVSQDTLRRWLRRGKKSVADDEFSKLLQAVKIAEHECVNRMVKLITTAAMTQWTAAAWFLERTRSERYGRDTRLLRELAEENAKLRAELAARGSLTPSRIAALPLPGQGNGNGHGSNGNGHGGNGTNGNGKH